MISKYKDYKFLEDEELEQASSNLNKLLEQGVKLRKNPKYVEKFKNQPPPNINPSLLELKENIDNEILERQRKKENED